MPFHALRIVVLTSLAAAEYQHVDCTDGLGDCSLSSPRSWDGEICHDAEAPKQGEDRCWQSALAKAEAICDRHEVCTGVTLDAGGYEPRGGTRGHVDGAFGLWLKPPAPAPPTPPTPPACEVGITFTAETEFDDDYMWGTSYLEHFQVFRSKTTKFDFARGSESKWKIFFGKYKGQWPYEDEDCPIVEAAHTKGQDYPTTACELTSQDDREKVDGRWGILEYHFNHDEDSSLVAVCVSGCPKGDTWPAEHVGETVWQLQADETNATTTPTCCARKPQPCDGYSKCPDFGQSHILPGPACVADSCCSAVCIKGTGRGCTTYQCELKEEKLECIHDDTLV